MGKGSDGGQYPFTQGSSKGLCPTLAIFASQVGCGATPCQSHGRTGGLCHCPEAPKDLSVRTKSSAPAPIKEEAGARKGVDILMLPFFTLKEAY